MSLTVWALSFVASLIIATALAYGVMEYARRRRRRAVSIVVQPGDRAKFPAGPINATVWPAGASAADAEIVRVTLDDG